MEDKSLFNSSQPQTISEGLQNFINSMVEEIVLEGRPFDTQKKYLKKFSENEGLDYDKLEADITTFIEILESLRVAFTKVQVKLAEEKGRECHISDETVKKLVSHSEKKEQPKPKAELKSVPSEGKETKKAGQISKKAQKRLVIFMLVGFAVGIVATIFLGEIGFFVFFGVVACVVVWGWIQYFVQLFKKK